MAKAYATIAREQHPKIPQSIEKIKHRLRDLNPANKIELQANDKELEQLALSGALGNELRKIFLLTVPKNHEGFPIEAN